MLDGCPPQSGGISPGCLHAAPGFLAVRVLAPENEVASPTAGLKASLWALVNLFSLWSPSQMAGTGHKGPATASCSQAGRGGSRQAPGLPSPWWGHPTAGTPQGKEIKVKVPKTSLCQV